MPTVEISNEQAKYFVALRQKMTEEYVGEYGHIRDRDVVQYLIDLVEGETDDVLTDSADPPAETDAAPADDEDRLTAMMNLLETHEDKWAKTDSDDGQYIVDLPNGGTEQVRTRDDVRAVLFKHYT